MKLSILIITIPERKDSFLYLLNKLEKQTKDQSVEVLALMDNRKRSIGEKRQNLFDIAKGDYVCMLDDDDDIDNQFIELTLRAIEKDKDVITFDQLATIDGSPFIVSFGLVNQNEQAQINDDKHYDDIKRKPFHMCLWKREVVKECKYPFKNYGEDAEWVDCACSKAKTEYHINQILHFYKFSTSGSTSAI